MNEQAISFPNLGITFEHIGKTINVFGIDIAYYGITIVIAMIMGILVAVSEAKRTRQDKEIYLDFALYAIVFSIIGARIYYVAFSWDNYKGDLLSILNIRQGGLAIYGGVIAAVLTLFIYSKIKKQKFWLMADTGCLGLVTGQIIGRYGNFFNREAFGDYTNSLFAMKIPREAVRTSDLTQNIINNITDGCILVHPTFLYESCWNLALLIFLLFYRKHKHFDGELFFIYLGGYGFGRALIEGLRTDQLTIGNTGIAVSQVLACVCVLISASVITFGNYRVYRRKKKYKKRR